MTMLSNFKVTMKKIDEKKCKFIKTRVQYTLTADEFDELGVNQDLVKSIRVVVCRKVHIHSFMRSNRSPVFENDYEVRLYIDPSEAAVNTITRGFHGIIRNVSLNKLTIEEAVMRLLGVNPQSNGYTVNAVYGLTKIEHELTSLIKLLVDLLDEKFTATGGHELVSEVELGQANV